MLRLIEPSVVVVVVVDTWAMVNVARQWWHSQILACFQCLVVFIGRCMGGPLLRLNKALTHGGGIKDSMSPNQF